ncbi:MAG: hypothetical protein V1725_01970, partial [archaeon]
STLSIEWTWYNNSVQYSTGITTGVSNNTNTLITTMDGQNTTAGETWTCDVRAYDSQTYSAHKNASVTINTPPTTITLLNPTNDNTTVRDLQPVFNWTAATDDDGDDINYTINVTYSYGCDNLPILTNSTVNNYTSAFEFCTYSGGTASERYYNWTVQACDYLECGAWATAFNFSIQPWVSINITTNSIDFGVMAPNQEKDTTADNPQPFVLVNDGNVQADLVNISGNVSLFLMSGLGNDSVQIKADNTTELDSFNWTSSTTDWTNLTASNQSIIKELDYNNSKDSAEIDVKVKVPGDEPEGPKQTWFIFTWQETWEGAP